MRIGAIAFSPAAAPEHRAEERFPGIMSRPEMVAGLAELAPFHHAIELPYGLTPIKRPSITVANIIIWKYWPSEASSVRGR